MAFEEHLLNTLDKKKFTKLPFPSKRNWRAIERLQLIHTDVWTNECIVLNCIKYFFIFNDDFARMCWISFLRTKFEFSNKFIEFKHMVEIQVHLSIKTSRTDNAREYTAQSFELQSR